MKLGLATMTKNQGHRLKEWVVYHNNIGHDKFIIFLDNCSDDSEAILGKLKIDGFDIDIYDTSTSFGYLLKLYWVDRSHLIYDFTLEKYNTLDWISFIEVDEFIFPQKNNLDFKLFLASLDSECLYINSWDFKPPFNENINILGQSYLCWTDKQRFESKYLFRGKSIIKPKYFRKCVDAHHFLSINGSVSDEFKIKHDNYIQINYGKEVTIDDTIFRIYHFRNHTETYLNDYHKIIY
jgi:hypothetical protein